MWDIIETDFAGDETVNFGPRKESGSALYQIDTIATVSCLDQENKHLPVTTSRVLGDLTCLAVEKNLIIKASSFLKFDHEIEELEWFPDGSLIILGLKSGMLFVIDVESTEIVFSANLVAEEKRVNGKSFRKITFTVSSDLVIMTADGSLFVQKDVQIVRQALAPLEFLGVVPALLGEKFSALRCEKEDGSINNMITDFMLTANTRSKHTQVHDMVVQGDYIYTLGSGPYILCKWSFKNYIIDLEGQDESFNLSDTHLTMGKATTDGNFLFVLDSNHFISIWDAEMLVCVKYFINDKVTDMTLLETNTSQNKSLRDVKLVVLTETNNNGCCLKVQTLPDWKSIYSLQLSAPSLLATCSTFQDALYVSEFCSDNKNAGTITTLRFRCLIETDPQSRLLRILQKEKFEEAEKFCNLYHLDIQMVLKAKVNYLMDHLSPWHVHKYDTDKVADITDQLWKCLNAVADDCYIAESCMRAALPTLSDTEKLLSHCKSRVQRSTCKDQGIKEKLKGLLTKVLEIEQRLMTYKLAFGNNSFSGDRWTQFLQVDLLQESLKWLDGEHLDTGFIIWTRHQALWTSAKLSRELIRKILSMIPHDTPATDILGYLSAGLLPCVVREVPDAVEDIVDFVIKITKYMEKADKGNWPKSAIKFANLLHARLVDITSVVITEDTCMAKDNSNKTRLKYDDTVLSPLAFLILKLQHLDDILHKYKCYLSLDQFLQETTETIAFRMLDKVVAVELIPQTLERQIRPYILEYGLNQDHIFSKYMKDLLERYDQVRSYSGEAPWEAKAMAILDCVIDVEQKIEGILEVMEWAPIPWSCKIDKLVQMGLQLKHSKVSKLKDQCQKVHVRKLLMKYGLKNIDIPQGSEAKHLVYTILTKDKDGCVDDALEVMQSCGINLTVDVYSFRMRQLITANRLEEGIELLRSLSSDVGMVIARHIVTYAVTMLNHTVIIAPIEDQQIKQKNLFTEAAIIMIKYLQNKIQDLGEVSDLKMREKSLTNILALQLEYKVSVTVEQYEDEHFRQEFINSYTKDFFTSYKQNESCAKVYRLASILQIPHTSIQGHLAITSANAGDIVTAVKICGELFESNPSKDTADTLVKVAHVFLKMLAAIDTKSVDDGRHRLLPEVCCRLASLAICVCEPERLCEYLELQKSCLCVQSVSQQCESRDSTLASPWDDGVEFRMDKELFNNLSLDVFQEDALLMNSQLALPLVCKYAVLNPFLARVRETALCHMNGEESEDADILRLCTSVHTVVQHLRENRHIQLAFNFSLDMMFTFIHYLQQQDMGLPFVTEKQKENIVQKWKTVENLNSKYQTMMKDHISTLVMKIFNNAQVDDKLAYAYLCTRPKREVVYILEQLVNLFNHQYKKLKVIASMGIALGQLFEDAGVISTCQTIETDASWGYRLKKMKISFDIGILSPTMEKTKLLPALARNEAADTSLVREFCQSYELDEDDGLLLYLDHLFVPMEEMVASNRENRTSVFNRANEAIDAIKKEYELLKVLQDIYYRTSAYDYETIEFILNVMKMRNDETDDIPVEKGLQLLVYLKVYIRHAPISEYETEYRIGRDKKDSQIFLPSLPAESKTRLPFHPLLHGNPSKIMIPELTKETVSTWLLVAKLLKLSSDNICMTAVQNMVRLYAETVPTPDRGSDKSLWNWRTDQANNSLLQDALQVLQHIQNCESSLVCANWMVNNLPLGSEKVLVLKQGIKLAELWHLSIPEENAKREKAKAAYTKFLSHWQKMASAQALCLNGLGEAELLQLTEKPVLLIQKLYEHPSIHKMVCDERSSKIDIHGAAENIAKINNISLDVIHRTLIEKWLQSGNSKQELDTTMTFSLENLKLAMASQEKEDDDDRVCFKRIVHLIQRGHNANNLMVLMDSVLEPKDGRNKMCCIRALRCVLYLCDDQSLKNICNKSLEELRSFLHIMFYLASLEQLHIQHTMETFVDCQKEGLVKGIWKNHSNEKQAVALISCLCLDYNIYDHQLWANLLQQMHSFGMMQQLEYVLVRINKVPELWQITGFCKIWYTVVSMPLMTVCSPLSKEQINMAVRNFNLMLCCPVLKELDLESLAKLYKKLDQPTCAVGCLLINNLSSDVLVKNVISQYGKLLLDNLRELKSCGFDLAMSHKIEVAVFAGIVQSERFEQVLDTSYQNDFVKYCVKQQDINSLLMYAVRNQRLNDAKTLLKVFTTAHPDVCLQLSQYIDEGEENENADTSKIMLKAYMKMNSLHE